MSDPAAAADHARRPGGTDRLAGAVAAAALIGFATAALGDLDGTAARMGDAFAWTTRAFGLLWQLLAVATFLVALALAVSPLGAVRLGGRTRPEMPYGRWLAVILCTLLAGGGVFWSAAEPMYHFAEPPPTFPGVTAASAAAVGPAMAQSFLHWGFLAWALVGTLGALGLLVLAERGVPLTPRALLVGVIGRRAADGPVGSLVDGLSIVAALAGTIGPIGFLGLQLAFAARLLLGAPDGYVTQLGVLVLLVLVATVSAASGIDRGIQLLSRLNVGLALALAGTILAVGPTLAIVRQLGVGMTTYLAALPRLALYRGDLAWLDYWTVFYWGWFLSYGPLMSIFVARISRGRTVREIVLAVAVVAPLLTNLWFGILGGSGVAFELAEPGSISAALDADGLPAALFAIVARLPLRTLLTPAFVVLIFVFLATSADSMAYAASMIVSGRSTPPVWQRVFWCVGMGVVAALLLVMGQGGIEALQSLIVVAAAPVGLLMATCLYTGPRLVWERSRQEARTRAEALATGP
ncbi:MAG: BCCT family transporter [Sandaracinaceae bacterium]